ncbi:MAG: hypothetical protein U0930_06500 [Pirellulales bacterium]
MPRDRLIRSAQVFVAIATNGCLATTWIIAGRLVALCRSVVGAPPQAINGSAFEFQSFSTVLIDLQAHGESSGEIITLGHLEKHDVVAAVEFAKLHHPNEKVAVIGYSLGRAAAKLAGPMQIDALIVEAVYSNIIKQLRIE